MNYECGKLRDRNGCEVSECNGYSCIQCELDFTFELFVISLSQCSG